MNEVVFWPAIHGRRVAQVAALACIVACGSGGKVDNARSSVETKNNMAVAKAADSAGAKGAANSGRSPVVLFFGTSLTAGLGLEPDQAYPSLIEKKALADGVPIKVVNAGLSGETTAGSLRMTPGRISSS
jgi:acyl-CoA thioesterase-1